MRAPRSVRGARLGRPAPGAARPERGGPGRGRGAASPRRARARGLPRAAIEAIGADAADAQMKTKRNWASSSESTALKLMGSGMVSASLGWLKNLDPGDKAAMDA